MLYQLLAEAQSQADKSKPDVRAAALMRIARVQTAFDRHQARATFEQALKEIRQLPGRDGEFLLQQARLLAAAVAPEHLGRMPAVIGAAVGYGAATALVRLLAAVAAPVADEILPVASNPNVTLCVPWLLIALAAIACYVPARRSASIDPIVTLREE
ncbi:MAG: hypothetical protein WBE37_11405 [Bryobacteraceae bacterium]